MTNRIFRGLGVSPGVVIGPVHLVDRRRLKVPRYHIGPAMLEGEVQRFERAVELVSQQFQELQVKAEESELHQVGKLIEAHEMLLRDEALMDATRKRIQNEGINAEWALKSTVREVKRLFDRLEKDYFRERRSDVDIVGDRLLRNLIGDRSDPLNDLPRGSVVVAHDLSPSDTVVLARQEVLGFVTEVGGRTSHTAIIARALNVPSVLGVHGLLENVGSGDQIIVDGRTGEIVYQPTDGIVVRYGNMKRRRQEEEAALLVDRELPAETLDGVQVALHGNVEVSQEIDLVLNYGGQGIGLYRTEFLQIECPDVRDHLRHFETYRDMVLRLGGKPFVIRSLDIGADKQHRGGNLTKTQSEKIMNNVLSPTSDLPHMNPALGVRGVRSSLQARSSFREQLKGVLLASAYGPIKLLIPFVTTIEEVREVRSELEVVMDDLRGEGRAFDAQLPLGIMIETPAAALLADIFAREVDFFAVGTNDLVQYILAADRGDDEVAYLYRPAHPAMLRILYEVTRVAINRDIPLSLCGEVAADPFYTPLLVGLGIRSLSMSPASIPVVKRLVRRLRTDKCTAFVREAMNMENSDEVETQLAECLKLWTPDIFSS
ncbi:MAG: phosphoenolpyruvate--protein phosphotransferase [Myxococcales bacterium]|nr:phosphoenolpyruvate--protein phosphotransferase [Myxococcales bacterium]